MNNINNNKHVFDPLNRRVTLPPSKPANTTYSNNGIVTIDGQEYKKDNLGNFVKYTRTPELGEVWSYGGHHYLVINTHRGTVTKDFLSLQLYEITHLSNAVFAYSSLDEYHRAQNNHSYSHPGVIY